MGTPKFSLNPAKIGSCDFESSSQIARKANYDGIGLRHNLLMDFVNNLSQTSDA